MGLLKRPADATNNYVVDPPNDNVTPSTGIPGLPNGNVISPDILKSLDRIAKLLENQAAQRPDNRLDHEFTEFRSRVNRNVGYGAYVSTLIICLNVEKTFINNALCLRYRASF